MSLSNIDTSASFTAATNVFAGAVPLSVGGENPDGPEWQCTCALSVWDVTNTTARTITIFLKGRNGRYTSLPSYFQKVINKQAAAAATGEVSLQFTPVGNAICRYKFVYYT